LYARALQAQAFAVITDRGVGQNTSFVMQIDDSLARSDFRQRVNQVDTALRMEYTLTAGEVDFVCREDARLLRDYGVAGDYECIGLVVVNEIASGYVQRFLMLMVNY
jgi:hypothetical protein